MSSVSGVDDGRTGYGVRDYSGRGGSGVLGYSEIGPGVHSESYSGNGVRGLGILDEGVVGASERSYF